MPSSKEGTETVLKNVLAAALMDRVSCGILICNQHGIILDSNKQVDELFCCSKEQIIGESYINFFITTDHDDDDGSALLQRLSVAQNIDPHTLRVYEGHIRQPNGRIRDVEYSVTFVEIESENFLLLVVLNDVTERNCIRSQTLLNDKLTTIGTLASGIAHEINNPLAWISANLNFLKEYMQTFQANLDNLQSAIQGEKCRKNLLTFANFVNDLKQQSLKLDEIINESIEGTEQIRSIVRYLKEFARADDEVSTTLIDIHEVIKSAIKMAYPEFKCRTKIETAFDGDIPPLLLNSGKLHQIFLNLIINAAQAMPEYNRLSNMIRITTSIEEEKVRIDISDTGMGIPSEILPRIFEPFFTTKPKGIGTGLGLSICQELIHKLHGDIQVQSTLDLGSTFIMYLPLQLGEEKSKQIQCKVMRKNTTHMRILVVDDEPSLLKTIERMLERRHRVTTALGGKAALELLIQHSDSFDVIICDLCMPDINGSDLYRYLAEKQLGLEKHIIFITGGFDAPQSNTFIAGINNPCIEKPFTQEELLRVIDEMITVTHST